MKYFRYWAILLVLVAVAFFVKQSHDHDHDAEASHVYAVGEADHDHAQAVSESEEEHVHAEGEAEHDHDHGAEAEGAIAADAEWETLVGLTTVKAGLRDMEEVLVLPGLLLAHPDKKALVSPLIEGSVNCLFVQVGDRVQEGQELACLSSPEIGMLRADYDKSKADLTLAQADYDRKKALFEDKVVSQRVLEESEAAYQVAQVAHAYAQKRLLAVGVSAEALDNPPTGHGQAEGSTLHLLSPIDGVVTQRDAFKGQRVDPAAALFEIVDNSVLWCQADVFEKDLARVAEGAVARIRVAAYPARFFTGRLFNIGTTLDPATKTIRLLAEFDNGEGLLKPGMYATVEVVTGLKTAVLAVPESTLLDDEQLRVVFVREGDVYHRHVVETGIASGGWVEIRSGLEEGALVVDRGNYQLRSKAKMGAVDPHAGHVH